MSKAGKLGQWKVFFHFCSLFFWGEYLWAHPVFHASNIYFFCWDFLHTIPQHWGACLTSLSHHLDPIREGHLLTLSNTLTYTHINSARSYLWHSYLSPRRYFRASGFTGLSVCWCLLSHIHPNNHLSISLSCHPIPPNVRNISPTDISPTPTSIQFPQNICALFQTML